MGSKPIKSRLSTRISDNSQRRSRISSCTVTFERYKWILWPLAAFPTFSSPEYRVFDIVLPHIVGPF